MKSKQLLMKLNAFDIVIQQIGNEIEVIKDRIIEINTKLNTHLETIGIHKGSIKV